jgi:hypothetical protein
MVLLHRLADSATVVTGAVVGLVAHAALPVTFERHGWCRWRVGRRRTWGYPHELWTTRLLPVTLAIAHLAQGTVCKILDEEDVT